MSLEGTLAGVGGSLVIAAFAGATGVIGAKVCKVPLELPNGLGVGILLSTNRDIEGRHVQIMNESL